MLNSKLLAIIYRYYYICIYRDTEQLKEIISNRSMSTIEQAASEQQIDNESYIKSFLDKKKRQIDRIPYKEHDKHVLEILNSTPRDKDGVITVTIALGESGVSGGFDFIFEDNEYRLNITTLFGSKKYTIKNDSSRDSELIVCKEGIKNICPAGGSVKMTCEDDCGSVFSGTWFDYKGQRFKCDYDESVRGDYSFRINEAGFGECSDNC